MFEVSEHLNVFIMFERIASMTHTQKLLADVSRSFYFLEVL